MMVMAAGSLIAVGSSSIVSRAFGADDSRRATLAAGTAFSIATIAGAILTIAGEIWIGPFLRILGASGDLLPVSQDYLRIILLTEPLILFNLTANALMRAEGQAKAAMVTMVCGMLLNILLDPIFIFVFGFGVQGAAWATFIGRSITTLLIVTYYLRGRSSMDIKARDLIPHAGILRETVVIGFSAFVRQAGSSFAATVRNNLLVAYGGTMFISSFGAVFRTIMFLGMPGMGIAQAVQPIAGYNFGAKKYDRVGRTVWVAIFICTLFMMLGFLITELFPGFFLGLFSSDNSLIGEGIPIMRISALLFLTFPAYIIAPSFYQAIGKPASALLLSLARPIFGTILMIVSVRIGGAIGVVYADPIAVTIGAVVAILYLRKSTRQIGAGISR
jgi:putative MATE family efflux protein